MSQSLPIASTITLFEHESAPFDWTERDWIALESLRRLHGAEILQLGLQRQQRTVRARAYVGVVRLNNRTIQVLPKIYPPDDRSEKEYARVATRNLLHLLSYASGLTVRDHDLSSLLRRDCNWLEILTFLFAKNLRAEWQRGAYRHYEARDAELPLLKGKWRIGEQLRRPERGHIFSVTFDEFTADNALNRVLRFVTERLWQLTRDAANRQLLGELRQWMEEDVPLPGRVTAAEAARITLTRQTARFGPVFNLAKLFLDDSALQLATGDTKSFAFTFDMNALFEGFVAGFLRRHAAAILPQELSDCTILPQSRGVSMHLARRDNKALFRLKPDVVFRDAQGAFPLLLDTKYKSLDDAQKMLGVAPADFYQMFAYAHRFACPRVLLLYPQTATMPAPLRAKFPLEGSDKIIEVATIDLRADLEKPAGRAALIQELKEILGGTA